MMLKCDLWLLFIDKNFKKRKGKKRIRIKIRIIREYPLEIKWIWRRVLAYSKPITHAFTPFIGLPS